MPQRLIDLFDRAEIRAAAKGLLEGIGIYSIALALIRCVQSLFGG